MNPFLILAQNAANANNGSTDTINSFMINPEYHLNNIWNTISALPWKHAVICVAFASIYLFYGWRIFRLLVIINVSLFGLWAGQLVGTKLSFEGSHLILGILGAFLGGLAAWTLMKYMVSAMGAMAGAVLGAAAWQAATLPSELLWVGGLVGLVAGGFLAFSSYKISIMLFSSLQGALLFSLGALTLVKNSPGIDPERMKTILVDNVFLLPAILIIPTMIGLFVQNKMFKENKNWSMPDQEGFKRN